jgi:hypothetical protein
MAHVWLLIFNIFVDMRTSVYRLRKPLQITQLSLSYSVRAIQKKKDLTAGITTPLQHNFTPNNLIVEVSVNDNSHMLWWTKWHWGSFSPSTSVSLANQHSTKFSIIIITRGKYKRPIGGRLAEWTQLDSTPTIRIRKNTNVRRSDRLYSFRHT